MPTASSAIARHLGMQYSQHKSFPLIAKQLSQRNSYSRDPQSNLESAFNNY
ncbi:MAG: hypothetical protein AAGE84_30740 [Cyanobacteria bacterium P01_G01_bin.39]